MVVSLSPSMLDDEPCGESLELLLPPSLLITRCTSPNRLVTLPPASPPPPPAPPPAPPAASPPCACPSPNPPFARPKKLDPLRTFKGKVATAWEKLAERWF